MERVLPAGAPLEHDDWRLLVAVAVRIVEQRVFDRGAIDAARRAQRLGSLQSLASTIARAARAYRGQLGRYASGSAGPKTIARSYGGSVPV